MRIAIGSDHRGQKLKKSVIKLVAEAGHSYEDFGCYTDESVDYPDIARKVAEAVAKGNFNRGILICGTGIGRLASTMMPISSAWRGKGKQQTCPLSLRPF